MLMNPGLFLHVAITLWDIEQMINVLTGGIVIVQVTFATVEVYLGFYCQIFHNLLLPSPLSKLLFFYLINKQRALFIVQTTEHAQNDCENAIGDS